MSGRGRARPPAVAARALAKRLEPPTPLVRRSARSTNRRGSRRSPSIPTPEIFGDLAAPQPGQRLYRLARSKAYLFIAVSSCAGPASRRRARPRRAKCAAEGNPAFPRRPRRLISPRRWPSARKRLTRQRLQSAMSRLPGNNGRVEWAIAWPEDTARASLHYYCNTIPTPDGGTHEQGLRSALTRGLCAPMASWSARSASAAIDLRGRRRWAAAAILMSLFMRDPQFQGQTKDRLVLERRRRGWSKTR